MIRSRTLFTQSACTRLCHRRLFPLFRAQSPYLTVCFFTFSRSSGCPSTITVLMTLPPFTFHRQLISISPDPVPSVFCTRTLNQSVLIHCAFIPAAEVAARSSAKRIGRHRDNGNGFRIFPLHLPDQTRCFDTPPSPASAYPSNRQRIHSLLKS